MTLPSIAELLPHAPPMVLLDRVVARRAGSITVEVTIGEESLFLGPEGVPGHIGLEYMAQACGAYAGAEALEAGQAVRVGFLLGTRHYALHAPWFRRGDVLLVSADEVYRDDEMGVFGCRIVIDGRVAAEAQLNVYQPAQAFAPAVPR